MNVVKSHKATIWILSLLILLIAGAILSLNMGKVSSIHLKYFKYCLDKVQRSIISLFISFVFLGSY